MKVIGFRASPTEVYYSIVEKTEDGFVVNSVEEIRLPLSLTFPEKLNFVRKTVKDLIFEYQITRAGIRTTESSAQKLSIERISIEAILQEALSTNPIEKYFVGQISNMFSKLNLQRTDIKKIVEKEEDNYNGYDLTEFGSKEREAILVAIACLNI